MAESARARPSHDPSPSGGSPARRVLPTPLEALAVLAIVALLCGFLAVFYRRGLREAAQATCTDCIYQIATAMRHYHMLYGHFPPAFVADDNGRPRHSWRVLLTEIFDRELHAAYRFDEPWDGPNNRKLADRMPLYYRCPNDRRSDPWQTTYLMIVGAEAVSRPVVTRRAGDVGDDPTKTILVAEVAGSGIHWMEPRDLDLSSLGLESSGPVVGSRDPIGSAFVFADFSVPRIPRELISVSLLRALATADGDEPIADHDWHRVETPP